MSSLTLARSCHSLDALSDILAWFRQRALARSAFESAAFAFATGVLALVLVLGAMALGLSPVLGRSLLALAILGGVLAAAAGFSAAWARFRGAGDVAHHLERCEPAFRTDLRSALDFAARTDADPDARALHGLLLTRITRELERRGPTLARYVPRRRLVRERAASFAGVFGLIVFAIAAPDPFRGAARALVLPGAVDDVPAASSPLISSVDVRLIYPAYTERSEDRYLFTAGEISALEGTRVQLTARLVEPVRGATFRVTQGDETIRVPAIIDANVFARAEFSLSGNGHWDLEVTRLDEEVARDPMERRLSAVPDQEPLVRLLEPEGDQEITPDHVVNFVYNARDDFGLSGVSLVWAFVGSEDAPHTLGLQGDLGVSEFEEHVPFDVQPLDLLPRDEIVVWIEAMDNDSLDGPNVGRSEPVRLRIGSPEDVSAALLADKEALFEALLTQLASELTTDLVEAELRDQRIALVPAASAAAERVTRVASAQEAFGGWPALLAQWAALNTAMAEDPTQRETDKMLLTAAYERLADGVRDSGRALEALPPAADSVPVSAYVGIATAHAPVVQYTEQAVVMLEDLIATHMADDVQRALDELSGIRDRLRELLERYRDTNDPELREQIERELARLEARMRELMERLAAQIPQLPTEHLNAEAIEASEVAENLQDMTSVLDQMREAMRNGDVDAALNAMNQLEQALNSLQTEVGDPLDNAETDTLSEFDQALGELMDEVNDIEAMEAELEAQTQELYDTMRERRAEETQSEVDAVLERLEERLAELRERYADLERTRLTEETLRGMENAERGLEQLAEQLEQRQIGGADDAAERVISQLNDTGWDLRSDEALLRRDAQGERQARNARRQTEDAERAVEAIQDQLQRMMELAQPVPTPGEQQEMQQLSQQQGQVRERMEGLEQRMNELGESFPNIPEQLGPPLQQAEEGMQQAQERLQQGKPRPAMQGEQQALQQLRQMRQQMQQMSQQQRQQEQQNGQRNNDNDVEVPEEAARGRQDYRERVIDAMRDDSLDAYEDEIRAYYESLLR